MRRFRDLSPDPRRQHPCAHPAGAHPPPSRKPLGACGVLLALLVGGLGVSCRTAKTSEARPMTVPHGQVSYEAVMAPGDSSSSLVPEVDYVPATPVADNPAPAYPGCLLALGLPPQKIVMRILVDDQGQVTALRASAVSSEADPVHRADFEAAIADAVQTWQFTPALRRLYGDSPDLDAAGRPLYRILKGIKPAPTYFDIRFVFETRMGKGVVTTQ